MPHSSQASTWSVGTDPRVQPTRWARLWYVVSLRPYGNDLLTRSSRSALMVMSCLMLLVATAEGIAWGYLGSAFTPQHPWLGGVALGLFVFVLMWLFDRSLVTFDFLEQEHAHTLSGQPPINPSERTDATQTKAARVWAWLGLHKGFMIRAIVVALSIGVTAPFLTQLMFKSDIQNKQRQYYQEAVTAEKNRVIATMQADQAKQIQRIEQTTAKLQNEMNGTGGSGRFGYGINAQAIQSQITAQEQRLNALYEQQRQRVAQIEQAFAAQDFAALSGLGVVIDQDSPMLRAKAIAEIKQDESYWQYEIAMIVLLCMLSGALFALKLMQSRALKLYFSSRLHEQWNLYCLGTYDADLPSTARRELLLESHDALPEEFERIMVDYMRDWHTHQTQREHEQQQARAKQHALEIAQQTQWGRMAQEQAVIDLNVRQREFEQQQIKQALGEIDQCEHEYLAIHQAELQRLRTQETELSEALHEQHKIYKTHVERVDARRQRIEEGKQERQDTAQKLDQLRQRSDCDRLQVLRVIEDMELATLRQTERLANQQAELLGFELTQRCYEENQQQLQHRLEQTRQRLAVLQQPLDAILQARAAVEARQVQGVTTGLIDSPYAAHHPNELPAMIEAWRGQLACDSAHRWLRDPEATVFDHEPAPQRQSTVATINDDDAYW